MCCPFDNPNSAFGKRRSDAKMILRGNGLRFGLVKEAITQNCGFQPKGHTKVTLKRYAPRPWPVGHMPEGDYSLGRIVSNQILHCKPECGSHN